VNRSSDRPLNTPFGTLSRGDSRDGVLRPRLSGIKVLCFPNIENSEKLLDLQKANALHTLHGFLSEIIIS
jgi:hypothetical protein